MMLNFGIIDVCDAVYMLEGWDESGQSMREFCYAFARDKLMKGDVVGHRRRPAVKKGLGGIIRREQQETAPGAYGSFVPCHSCVYAQHLFGGGMQCRNLRGLACEVKEDDGCSHGVFPEGSRL